MLNDCNFIGNLGSDPEIKVFESGVKYARFNIGINESYKNKSGEEIKRTEWVSIVLYRGLAEVAEKYLHKGDQVHIKGSLRSRSYEKDNIKHYITEIIGSNLVMLRTKSNNQTPPPPPPPEYSDKPVKNYPEKTAKEAETEEKPLSETMLEDDLPF